MSLEERMRQRHSMDELVIQSQLSANAMKREMIMQSPKKEHATLSVHKVVQGDAAKKIDNSNSGEELSVKKDVLGGGMINLNNRKQVTSGDKNSANKTIY
jgi:hypothetical protein